MEGDLAEDVSTEDVSKQESVTIKQSSDENEVAKYAWGYIHLSAEPSHGEAIERLPSHDSNGMLYNKRVYCTKE